MDYSPPGFLLHGIPQAGRLEWIAISFSRRSSRPRGQPGSPASPALAGGFFTTEPPGNTAESEDELRTFLMKVKRESEKAGLKLNIQKTKIMASSPITSWQIDGETVEIMTDFIFLGSKITADGDFSHEIKKHLLLGRKVMTNLDSVLESKDITLPTKSI